MNTTKAGYQEAGGGFVGNDQYQDPQRFDWQGFAQGLGSLSQQKTDKPRIKEDLWIDPRQYQLEGDLQLSSRHLKVPASPSNDKVTNDKPIQRGARGLSDINDIDANGVQIAAIQDIAKRVMALRQRINELKENCHG